jgi:Icc-related predicted phosphoesterase
MKILALSDLHGKFDNFRLCSLPPANLVDIVIVAGDITHYGASKPLAAQELERAEHELSLSLDWMSSLSDYYRRCARFWIPGNHEYDIPNSFYDSSGWECIYDKTIQFQGLLFHGVSLTMAHDRPQLAELWPHTTVNPELDLEKFSFSYSDVIVSHSPPLGCLDGTERGVNIGSPGLKKYIEKMNPKLVICGHVHESRGIVIMGGTLIVNAAKTWLLIEIRSNSTVQRSTYCVSH